MDPNSIYGPVLLDHVSHPEHFADLDHATHTQQGVNPTCGDELAISMRINDAGVIEDVAWTGTGCAISKGSADIMADLLIDETVPAARHLSSLFGRMVRGETLSAAEQEELDEAMSLESISRMPARVKCAELAWRTMDKMLADLPE